MSTGPRPSTPAPPLLVDRDATLIATDLLLQPLLLFVRQLRLPLRLLRGKAQGALPNPTGLGSFNSFDAEKESLACGAVVTLWQILERP